MTSFSQDDLDEEAKRTWDDSYVLTETADLWGGRVNPFIDNAINLLLAASSSIILDLPCGDGRNTLPLARELPFVVGADTSPHALDIAAKALKHQHIPNVILLQADIFRTPFVSDQFDGVFCWDLLGHLSQVSAALTELLRICRPDGLIHGSLFSLGDSTRGVDMVTIGKEEYMYRDKYYFKYYDHTDVLRLLAPLNATLVSLDLAEWEDPPHEGYREYPHRHESWAFTIRKDS